MKPIERESRYYKGKPAMVLRPAVRDNGKRFIIKLDDIWKYSENHNELFELFFANKVILICKLFDIAVPKGEKLFAQIMASIAIIIMEGIDDLVKMPPYQPEHDDPGMVIDMKPTLQDMPDINVGIIQ